MRTLIKPLGIFALLLICGICVNAQSIDETVINNIGKKYCPDKRIGIWEVKVDNKGGKTIISGQTDNAEALAELERIASKCKNPCEVNISMLPDVTLSGNWAFTIIPYAHLRAAPGHDKEMATQSLMGNPMKVLSKDDDWYRVQTPDGYIAWVIGNSIKIVDDDAFNKWLNSKRYIVTDIYTYLYDAPNDNADVVTDVVLGNILEGKDLGNGYLELSTPDGRKGFIKSSSVAELSKWAQQEFNADQIVDVAKMLMGSTYTWGGTSTKGVDCSGLTKTAYFSNGIILQRDASQQVLYGGKINPKDWKQAKKGDLLYFGTKSGKITHTAIYMQDGNYIHASGKVKVNSVDPDSKIYLTTPFHSINRINGYVDTKGIASVKNHPWYFKQ